jgi:hypothetical protein
LSGMCSIRRINYRAASRHPAHRLRELSGRCQKSTPTAMLRSVAGPVPELR